MSDNINDGGPAFPVSPEESRGKVSSVHGGMTLRDHFAAMAMAGSLAGVPGTHLVPYMLAREAYAMADEMLKARQS